MPVVVYAVEDRQAQVSWRAGRHRSVTVSAGPATETVRTDGGGGALLLSGLPPCTTLELRAAFDGAPLRRAGWLTTLAVPPGRLLCRFATVNDLHVGATSFGTLHPIFDAPAGEPHAARCAVAALDEARAWGAGHLVAKGDLTQGGLPEEWDELAELLSGSGLAVVAIEGNHDVRRWAVDGRNTLARRDIHLSQSPEAVDLPGIRIVTMPTTGWHVEMGVLDPAHQRRALQLLAAAPGAAALALHHYPQRWRYPTMKPAGITGPVASRFLDAVAEANPATIVLSGHSHRNRRHRHGPLVVTEVGATKDYPGGWAGYAVHERGIRQVHMRTMRNDVFEWTERGRRVVGGVWGVWAPGVLSHRCFVHEWPTRP